MIYDYTTEKFKIGDGIAEFGVPDWRYIRKIRINQFSNQYVSEALKGEFTGWFKNDVPAVFISSPTGSGKNFFIELHNTVCQHMSWKYSYFE